jgi:hypothetical protein
MLAGVLLHVVKPACPINLALDCFPFDPSTGFILSSSASLTVNSVEGLRASFAKGRPFHLATYNVHYGPVMLPLEDIADGEAIEGALIVGLAAGGGIETGLVHRAPGPGTFADKRHHSTAFGSSVHILFSPHLCRLFSEKWASEKSCLVGAGYLHR